MLSQCQQSIDDKDNVWAFMLRHIVDVFVIMAYDKLKARLDDLAVITAAQCEAIVIEFDLLCTSRKICPSILCNQFTGHKLPSEFHNHVNVLPRARHDADNRQEDLGAVD
jgi:hypothetical protein